MKVHKEFLLWPGILLWILTPLYLESPAWATACSLFFIGSKIIHYFYGRNLISKGLKNFTSIIILFATLASFKTLLGYAPAITLFILYSSIKFAEAENTRDYRVLIYFLFFLLISNAIYYQNLYITIHILVSFLLLAERMLAYSQQRPGSWNVNILKTLKYFAIFLPLIMVFFFLFPRYGGERMGLPGGVAPDKKMVGMSNMLNPADFSLLLDNPEISFRAVFPPEKKVFPIHLYWRGMALSETDGMRWQKTYDAQKGRLDADIGPGQEDIDYEIILEPHWNNTLFTLESPLRVDNFSNPNVYVYSFQNNTFESVRRITVRLKYRGVSRIANKDFQLSPQQRKINLITPFPPSGEVKKIFDQLYDPSPQKYRDNILNFFRQNLSYTWAPGNYGDDPRNFMQQLLLENKKGLCGHFASAMALLLRWGNVPSRVIIGYQGGEFNDYGQYWLVKQKNAHAWVEMFIEKEGWIRVDPTIVIFPDRLNNGPQIRFEAVKNSWPSIYKYVDQTMLFVDGINYYWARFLLDFDKDWQKEKFEKILRKQFNWLTILGQLLFGSVLFFLLIYIIRNIAVKGGRKSLEQKIILNYQKFVNKMEREGYTKDQYLDPGQYYQLVRKRNDALANVVQPIINQYIEWRYAGEKINWQDYVIWRKNIKELKAGINKF
jgi:protein-glutamine gamma-glutamyltransferase